MLLKEEELRGVDRTLYTTRADISRTRGTLTKLDHTVGNKANLNKFGRAGIIQSIFSGHKGIKLETKNKKY